MTALQITQLLIAATEAATLSARALEALNNGDENAARLYLGQARDSYEESRRAWDEAAG